MKADSVFLLTIIILDSQLCLVSLDVCPQLDKKWLQWNTSAGTELGLDLFLTMFMQSGFSYTLKTDVFLTTYLSPSASNLQNTQAFLALLIPICKLNLILGQYNVHN